jgi:hypothetical protein
MPNQDVSNVGATSTTRRRTRARTRRRTTTAGNGGMTGGVRTGAGTGIGGGGETSGVRGGVNLAGLTTDQRKFYELGQRHACEMHGINWQGRSNR